MFRSFLTSSSSTFVVGLLWLAATASTTTTTFARAQQQGVVDGEQDLYCSTLHVDFARRQVDEWKSPMPYTVEDGTKHTPFLTFDAVTRTATIIVGNGNETGGIYHPMQASDDPLTVHFITHIYAVDQDNRIIASQAMDPTMPAPAMLVIPNVPEEVTSLTAFEFCNLHGHWQGPTVVIPPSTTTSSTSSGTARTSLTSSDTCSVGTPQPAAFDSYAADFVRRQSLPPFSAMIPYTEDDGALHTPYITIHQNNNTATVIVGTDEMRHVMIAGGDEPHWINDIFVVDQNDNIVTLEALNPSFVDHAEISFAIPSTATELTAYEWCNVHGLYRGPTVSVATGEIIERADNGVGGPSGARPMYDDITKVISTLTVVWMGMVLMTAMA